MVCLMSFPRYTHRQSPQTIAVVQQLVWIIAPQRLGAVVLAPQPAAQPVPHPVLGLAEHARALPVMEISTPASQQLVQVSHCLGYAPRQRPVVQLFAHLVPEPLPASGTRFDVRITSPTPSGALPAHAKAQEVETVPAMHLPGLFFVELQPSCLQPAPPSLHQLGPLPRCAQDDKVIRVAHQGRSPWFLGIVYGPIQRVEVGVGKRGRDAPALRPALPVGQDPPFAAALFLHYRSIQPLPQQVQYAAVTDTASHQL